MTSGASVLPGDLSEPWARTRANGSVMRVEIVDRTTVFTTASLNSSVKARGYLRTAGTVRIAK